jgi:hypothetical protein
MRFDRFVLRIILGGKRLVSARIQFMSLERKDMRQHSCLSAAVLGGVLGVVCLAGSADAQNLLTNGNLDQGYAQEINPPAPGFFLPKPASWINEGSRAISGPYEDEMSLEPWAGPAPTPVTTDGNGPHPNGVGAGMDGAVFFKAFSGNATDGAATGHLYQDKPAVVGATYTLTGWAGAEANYLAAQSVFAIDFLNALSNPIAGGAVLDLGAAGLLVPNGQPFNYKQYSLNAVAPPGAVFVRARVSMIGGLGNPAGGGQAFVVDDFSLVPEPTSMSLLAGGLLLAARRRRKSA